MRELSHRNLQIGGYVVALIAVAYLIGFHFLIFIAVIITVCYLGLMALNSGQPSTSSGIPIAMRDRLFSIGNSLFGDTKMFQKLTPNRDKHKNHDRNTRSGISSPFRQMALRSPKVGNENRNITLNNSASGPLLSPFLPRARRVHDSFNEAGRFLPGSLTERVMLTAQRRYPTHQAKYGIVGVLPSVRLSRPARHALTERNSSMLHSPVTVKIAPPDVITNTSPLVSLVYEKEDASLNTSNPCDTSTVMTALREKRKRTLKEQNSSSPATSEGHDSKRRRQHAESPVSADSSASVKGSQSNLPNGGIGFSQIRASLKRPAAAQLPTQNASPESDSKRTKPNAYITPGWQNSIASSYSSTKRLRRKQGSGSGTGGNSFGSRDSSLSRDSSFSQDTSFSKDWALPQQQMSRQDTAILTSPVATQNDSRSSTPNLRLRRGDLSQVDSRSSSPASSGFSQHDTESTCSESRSGKKRLFHLTRSNSSRRRNTPIYSPLAGSNQPKVAPEVSSLTEEDYENDRKADEERIQQMLRNAEQAQQQSAAKVSQNVCTTASPSTQAPLLSSLLVTSSSNNTAVASPVTSALGSTTSSLPSTLGGKGTSSSLTFSLAQKSAATTSGTLASTNLENKNLLTNLSSAPQFTNTSVLSMASTKNNDSTKVTTPGIMPNKTTFSLSALPVMSAASVSASQTVSLPQSSVSVSPPQTLVQTTSTASSSITAITSSTPTVSSFSLSSTVSKPLPTLTSISSSSSGPAMVSSVPQTVSTSSTTVGGFSFPLTTSTAVNSPASAASTPLLGGFSFAGSIPSASVSTVPAVSVGSSSLATVSASATAAAATSAPGSSLGGFSLTTKVSTNNFSFGLGQQQNTSSLSTTSTQPATTFSFSSSQPQQQANVSAVLSSTSSVAPATNFSFGAQPAVSSVAVSSSIAAAPTSQPASLFNFGAGAPPSANSSKPAVVGGFSFTAQKPTSSVATTTAGSMLQSTTLSSSSVFGQMDAKSAFGFGQNTAATKTSTAAAAPASGVFAFGNTSSNNSNNNALAAASQSAGFSFGGSGSTAAAASTGPASGTSGFTFSASTQSSAPTPATNSNLFTFGGGNANQTTAGSGTFSFGSSNQNQAPTASSSTTGGFVFGAKTATTTSSSAFSFGGGNPVPAASSVFGQQSSSSVNPANNSSAPQATSVFAFGGAPTNDKKSVNTSVFGQSTNAATTGTGAGVFGAMSQSSTPSIFATPKQSAPAFGNSGGSAFTTPTQQPATSQNAFGFGDSKPAAGGFDFSKSAAPSTGGFSFGGSQNPAPTASVPFGQSTPQQLTSGTGFNFGAMPAPPAFGSVTPMSNQPQFNSPGTTPNFGANSSTSNMFSMGSTSTAPRPRSNVRARRRGTQKR